MDSQTADVSIKAVSFHPAEAPAWFRIMEAQFALSNVTVSSTRFHHALANLPVETVAILDDTILQASDYDELKQAVQRYYEKSRGELFDNFLQETPLTGKPSHFLLQMAKIAKKVGVGDDMVRHRFQQALPRSIAPVIASQRTLGLEDLGRLADELLPLLKTTELTSSVTSERHAVNFNRSPSNTSISHDSRSSTTLVPYSPNQRPKVCEATYFMGLKHGRVDKASNTNHMYGETHF